MKDPRMRCHCYFATLVFSTFILATAVEAEPTAPGPRESVEIKAGWRFQIDWRDIGERARWFDAALDRSGWSEVEVPRAWDLFDEALRGYEGIGWYSVILDGSWARRARSST